MNHCTLHQIVRQGRSFQTPRHLLGASLLGCILLGILSLNLKAEDKGKINYDVPLTSTLKSISSIPETSSAADLRNLTQFPEALIPSSNPSTSENRVFSKAVNAWLARTSTDDFKPLENFLSENTTSPWRMAALVNLGLLEVRSGYYSKAIANFTTAWNEGQSLTSNEGIMMADRAYAELLYMHVHLGHVSETTALMALSDRRQFSGKAPEVILRGQKFLADMQLAPKSPTFQCGPSSLGVVAYALKAPNADTVALAGHHAVSDTNGFSLQQLGDMSQQFGLPLQMAYRAKGAAVITPAVMHLGLNHYSALVQADKNNHYLLNDIFLGQPVWLSKKAVDSEASGYFLVPSGALPDGWRSVSADEASSVWGSGNTPNPPPPPPDKCTSCPAGMPVAMINLQLASALLKDRPVGYHPPVGQDVSFNIQIDQGDTNQPTSFNFSNMGSFVFFGWVGYVEFNPSVPNADVTIHSRGGGMELAQGFNTNTGTYLIGQYTGAITAKLSATTFGRYFSDGTIEYYYQDDGVVTNSGTTLKRAFLGQIVDPQGNQINLNYDGQHRLVGIKDSLGQVTTLSYGNASDPYKITQVTDPFGRTSSFSYTSKGVISSITDALGLTTTFAYNGGVLNSMTTPYGTTSFARGYYGGNNVWVQITDPIGGKERAESWPTGMSNVTTASTNDPLGYPTGMPYGNNSGSQYLQYRTTYYWGKHAMMVAPGDYNAAHAYQFNHRQDSLGNNFGAGTEGNTLESEKPPYASRIWYNYPGQTGSIPSIFEGTLSKPSGIGRIVQDANGNNVSQVTLRSYNSVGNITQETDPKGRVTSYSYAANGVDVTGVTQGGSTLFAATYNTQHLPVTITDAAGQTTTISYNTFGEPLSVTDALGNTTTYSYDGNGYLLSINGPMGATTTFTYDTVGRVKTKTDSVGYTLTYSYDNLDRITAVSYSGGGTETITYNRLDVASITDRLGRTTSQWWDANRHLSASRDPLGRTTQYGWCSCGTLESLTDPNGNVTKFSYDPAVRLTAKTYADGKGESYSYDLSGRPSTTTDALGQIKTTKYNVDDTVASVSYANAVSPTPSLSYSWDTNYPRITAIGDGSGTTSFSYAPFGSVGGGKPSGITTPLATLSYGYDALGRVTTRSVNGSSNTETIAYDALGRVTNVVNPLGSFGYNYADATPRLSSLTMPGGLQSSYTYYGTSGDERLSQIQNLSGSNVVSSFGYQYDTVGNITQWTQSQPGAFTHTQAWGNQYDGADQLLGSSVSDTVSNSIVNNYAFAYDSLGNRLSKQQNNSLVAGSFNSLNQLSALTSGSGKLQVSGAVSKIAKVTVLSGTNSYPATTLWGTNFSASIAATLGTNTFSVVAQDENTNLVTNRFQINVTSLEGSRSFSYDANGNTLNDGQRIYTWDAANRLASVTIGTNTYSFGYDFAGRRVSEQLNGTLINQTVWDVGGSSPVPLEERSASNTVSKQFYAQGEVQGGTNYFYLRDHLGSVRELVSGGGAVVSEITYDPYGVATVAGTVTPTFQYAGYYAHQGTGLDLTWYRAYDPVVGRWQARDPLPNAERLEGLNLYEYVRGRTLGRIDPTGLIDWKVVIVCILGACSPDGPEDPPKPPSPPPSSQPACPKAGPTPKPSPTPLNPKTIPWWFAVPITVVGILSTS